MGGIGPHYGLRSANSAEAASALNAANLTIVMLETPTAIANAEEIAAVPGIDVTAEEPLAPNSPLWGMEQVLLTPHTAGETRHYEHNVIEILRDNLERMWRGDQQLRNQVV